MRRLPHVLILGGGGQLMITVEMIAVEAIAVEMIAVETITVEAIAVETITVDRRPLSINDHC